MATTKNPYGTDDELYRVDSVWLGPPRMTFPWQARYISWGVGMVTFLLVFAILKAVFGFGFFTAAWAAVLTVVLTRWIGKKITHERPFGAVFVMGIKELNTPRIQTKGAGGSTTLAHVRFKGARPTADRKSGPRSRPAHRADATHAIHGATVQRAPAVPLPNSVSPPPPPPNQPPYPQRRVYAPTPTMPQHPQQQWPGHRIPDWRDQHRATPRS